MGGFYNPQLGEIKTAIEKHAKIGIKDIVPWVLVVIGIAVAIYYGDKSTKLENNRQLINRITINIQQEKGYDNLPKSIKEEIDNIAVVSSDAFTFSE